jgi:hypothetical protein
MPNPLAKGNLTLQSDEAGLRAFSDLLAGQISEGKARPNTVGAYWKNRSEQERELTARENRPGFLTSLFSGAQNGN